MGGGPLYDENTFLRTISNQHLMAIYLASAQKNISMFSMLDLFAPMISIFKQIMSERQTGEKKGGEKVGLM